MSSIGATELTELLTLDQIEQNKLLIMEAANARLNNLTIPDKTKYEYVRPLSDSYASLIETIENTEQRFMLGLDPIDVRTRGFGAKELVLLTGFAHSGKTQIINTAICRNKDKPILFFSMDDPSEMILNKLVCMETGVDAETLERRIRGGDEKAKLSLRQAATATFRKLVVVDESLSLGQMTKAVAEFEAMQGCQPAVVIIDYVASMQGEIVDEDGGIKSKMAALKRWVKDKPFPTIAIHQNTRSRGGPGEPITMLSGGYGGEQEATFVLGVRRKKDWDALDAWERDRFKDTVTIHLVKNKRPPGKLTNPDGIDFLMDAATGMIKPISEFSSAQEAMASRAAGV